MPVVENHWKLKKNNYWKSRGNLSGTFGHNLLLAKLNTYGFSDKAWILLQSYLYRRFQRSMINYSFSTWNEVKLGVSQELILGLLLFNIFLNDIFLLILKCRLCNYANNNTLYKSWKICRKLTVIWKWTLWTYANGFNEITWY